MFSFLIITYRFMYIEPDKKYKIFLALNLSKK